jgi:hypothetical protein
MLSENEGVRFRPHRRDTYNTTATLYYKNTIFTWWERLPAANIAVAPYYHRLSRLEAAPTKADNPVKPKYRFSNNLPHYIISVLAARRGHFSERSLGKSLVP